VVDVVSLAGFARRVIHYFDRPLIAMVDSPQFDARLDFTVDDDVSTFDLNMLSGQANHALDVVRDDRLLSGRRKSLFGSYLLPGYLKTMMSPR